MLLEKDDLIRARYQTNRNCLPRAMNSNFCEKTGRAVNHGVNLRRPKSISPRLLYVCTVCTVTMYRATPFRRQDPRTHASLIDPCRAGTREDQWRILVAS